MQRGKILVPPHDSIPVLLMTRRDPESYVFEFGPDIERSIYFYPCRFPGAEPSPLLLPIVPSVDDK
jgi:hypothetical protein